MPAAIFDIAEISKRREELFGYSAEPALNVFPDREHAGTAVVHCGICPKREFERCDITCHSARERLADGITIKHYPTATKTVVSAEEYNAPKLAQLAIIQAALRAVGL